MVEKRMYITGGIGALPVIEGFGRDYELDPEYAYTETCAALGSIFWDREMARITGEASYADLYERQLYNAVLVGMGIDGRTYFYNNPLASQGGIERRNWYEVPCCPSNLSRTIAWLQRDVLNLSGDMIDIAQYFSSRHIIEHNNGEMVVKIDSALPWEGGVKIHFTNPPFHPVQLRLRFPSWAKAWDLELNGELIDQMIRPETGLFNPKSAKWIEINRTWESGDQLSLAFPTPVEVYHPDEKIDSVRNKVALTRGPLVYCLENIDNPFVDIFEVKLKPDTIRSEFSKDVLGGVWTVKGYSTKGELLTFIPYYLWGNRGASKMSVFIGMKEEE